MDGDKGICYGAGGTKASLLIDCSTISPTTSGEIAAAVSEARLHSGAQPFPGCSNRAPAFIDAPVSGGTTGASAATLSFMVRPPRNTLFLLSIGDGGPSSCWQYLRGTLTLAVPKQDHPAGCGIEGIDCT